MRIAHLILTHKNPKQLERLIGALNHPGFDFYIHIDKKVKADPFLYLATKKNVYFIKKRTKIYWAGFGTIHATLYGFEEILPKGYDYINVISGQDFPLKSAEDIYQYFYKKQGKEFITCESVEDTWTEAASRVKKYHLINWRIPGKYRIEKLLNMVLPTRKIPLDYKIVGRANWFTITNPAAHYIQTFLREHPDIVRFFKYSWGADELIFSTILYNSRFKDQIENNLVYVNWSGPIIGHPKILVTDDYDRLIHSGKLFARKFDAETDSNILTMLEKLTSSHQG